MAPGLCKPYARGSLRLLKRRPGGRQSSIVSPRDHAFESTQVSATRPTDLAAGPGGRVACFQGVYMPPPPPILRGETGFSWIPSALSRSRIWAWARAYPRRYVQGTVNAATRGEDRLGPEEGRDRAL